jgi:hypothetical protein
MPSSSISQQQAAVIAHAAAKGKLPKSQLRGASKEMYKSMKRGDLRKFAKTSHKGLPKRVESIEHVQACVRPLAAQIVEDLLTRDED